MDLEQILKTTDTVVQELLATGEFGNCTFRDVLSRVDTRLEFPQGTLIECEHKSTVKERIRNLLSQAEEAGGRTPSSSKKRTSRQDVTAKPNKRRKTDTIASDQESSDTKPTKSRKTLKPKGKKIKTERVSKRETKKSGVKARASGKLPQPVISAETVDSDLDDTDLESPGDATGPSGPTGIVTGSTDGVSAQKRPPADSEELVRGEKDVGDRSESEISVLLDDEPPKRRRKIKDEKNEIKPKKTRQKKEKKELSRDEETIKRLKSLVVACGVRKVWSKEFKDLNSSSAQIKRLKSILSELGMSGRMSLEQAKAIKAKREFARELEDIKDFEKKVVGGSEDRPSSRKDSEASDEDESNDEEDKPRKKRINARNSINAFLGDQSDED